MATTTRLLRPPVDAWDAAAAALTGRDAVLHRSHLVGADPALTRQGGGNFSAKGTVVDHRGALTEVLWMSAWGCDGATTTPADFPALRLDDLRLLRHGGAVTEREMVDHLIACGLTGEQRRPGIETLTHAFLPAAHVDHSHPDAVIALTAIPDGRDRARAEFGDEAIWFDYRQFDVGVAREIADRVARQPACRFVLLANHGLFTWADTSERCYRNALEAVARATRALERAVRRPPDLGGTAVPPLPDAAARRLLVEVLPVLRGAVAQGRRGGPVLHVDTSAEAVAFASSVRGPELTARGPGCPDHVVTTGYRPLVSRLASADDPAAALLDDVAAHRRWYVEAYRRHVASRAEEHPPASAPRAVLMPGLGAVCAGADASAARLCADHLGQSVAVIRAADAAGGYASLTEAQGFGDEYWPLIRLKPQLRPPDGPLAGTVLLVVGADDERTVAVAERLAAADAHVAVGGTGGPRLAAGAAALSARFGERRVVAVDGDEPDEVVAGAVLAYGGFDVVVDLTRWGGVVPAALPVLVRQHLGGWAVLANAGWTREELAAQVAALEARRAHHGVTVLGLAGGTAREVAAAAAFVTTSNTWRATVLASWQEPAEGAA